MTVSRWSSWWFEASRNFACPALVVRRVQQWEVVRAATRITPRVLNCVLEQYWVNFGYIGDEFMNYRPAVEAVLVDPGLYDKGPEDFGHSLCALGKKVPCFELQWQF